MRIEKTGAISTPPQRVWEVMSDVVRWNEWTPSIKEIVFLDPGPFRLGSRALVRQPRLPSAIWHVTEFEPGRGFSWENNSLGAYSVGEHWIDSNLNGCGIRRRHNRVSYAVHGSLDRRIVAHELRFMA
jgi:hypothetical protein